MSTALLSPGIAQSLEARRALRVVIEPHDQISFDLHAEEISNRTKGAVADEELYHKAALDALCDATNYGPDLIRYMDDIEFICISECEWGSTSQVELDFGYFLDSFLLPLLLASTKGGVRVLVWRRGREGPHWD